jgi:hypothetical protein
MHTSFISTHFKNLHMANNIFLEGQVYDLLHNIKHSVIKE